MTDNRIDSNAEWLLHSKGEIKLFRNVIKWIEKIVSARGQLHEFLRFEHFKRKKHVHTWVLLISHQFIVDLNIKINGQTINWVLLVIFARFNVLFLFLICSSRYLISHIDWLTDIHRLCRFASLNVRIDSRRKKQIKISEQNTILNAFWPVSIEMAVSNHFPSTTEKKKKKTSNQMQTIVH